MANECLTFISINVFFIIMNKKNKIKKVMFECDRTRRRILGNVWLLF
jgi:hypothetical protein